MIFNHMWVTAPFSVFIFTKSINFVLISLFSSMTKLGYYPFVFSIYLYSNYAINFSCNVTPHLFCNFLLCNLLILYPRLSSKNSILTLAFPRVRNFLKP